MSWIQTLVGLTLLGCAARDTESASAGQAGAAAHAPALADDDPYYARARYLDGTGWELCPAYSGLHGISCLHTDARGQTGLCAAGLDCNTCLCLVPCGTGPGGAGTCPPSVSGNGVAECFDEPLPPSGTCRLTCDDAECPPSMTCVTDPELERRVCMWVEPT